MFKNWKPVDHIVLVLAITVSTLLLFSAIIVPLMMNFYFNKDNYILVRAETVKLIFGAVSSFISIISMYIGAKIQKYKDESSG
jgi:hypothetical protein